MSARAEHHPDRGRETLAGVVDLARHGLGAAAYRADCRARLQQQGVLVLPGFLTPAAIASVAAEGLRGAHRAYFCTQQHNVYLTAADRRFAADHVRNRTVTSSKGCITDDCIAPDSPLRQLYDATAFREFLCAVLGETALHAYADPLSSINLHYARDGQELGWHFDNSAFATTLMIQPPLAGGTFEYVSAVRDADTGDMGYQRVRQVLEGELVPQRLTMEAGALVLFRGRNALHRVSPVAGGRTRMLAVLAYNGQPGIALSESARMTFYGRLG